jgi:hypothetical protein
MNAGRDEIGNEATQFIHTLLLTTTSSRFFNNPTLHEPRLIPAISLWLRNYSVKDGARD